MTKEGSAKIANFITIGAGSQLGCGYISHYSEYVLSSTLSIYISLIAIVLKGYNAAFLCHLAPLLLLSSGSDGQCKYVIFKWPKLWNINYFYLTNQMTTSLSLNSFITENNKVIHIMTFYNFSHKKLLLQEA